MEKKIDLIKIQSDEKPPKRSSFGLCKLNNNTIAIFGGYNGHLGCYFDDFWMLTGFKNNNYKWIQIKRQNNAKWPERNAGNALHYHAKLKNIYLCGGRNNSESLDDDLWIFNVKSKDWIRVIKPHWILMKWSDMNNKNHKSMIYKDYIIFFAKDNKAIYTLNCLKQT